MLKGRRVTCANCIWNNLRKEGLGLLGFLFFILIIISFLFFLMGHAYLNNKAEGILMWSFTGKIEKVKDKDGYKKLQGKHCILMGMIFLLVPISIYLVEQFNINKKSLYLWQFVLASAIILNVIQVRKYF